MHLHVKCRHSSRTCMSSVDMRVCAYDASAGSNSSRTCVSSVDVREYRVTYELNIMHACAYRALKNERFREATASSTAAPQEAISKVK